MRIHTDSLTISDIYAATKNAGPRVDVEVRQHGSRSRARAFNVTLTGTSPRRTNSGKRGAGDEHAATWDEWGMFLAELFRRDPNAVAPNAYESGEHFRWVTGARFDNLTPAYQHGGAGHRWSGAYPNATGTYYVVECTSCEAIMRRMEYGHTFAEIAD
jgi:hypothetical protein